jgi:hypothetical protein
MNKNDMAVVNTITTTARSKCFRNAFICGRRADGFSIVVEIDSAIGESSISSSLKYDDMLWELWRKLVCSLWMILVMNRTGAVIKCQIELSNLRISYYHH